MHQYGRAALALLRTRHLGEAGVEVAARRGGDQTERPLQCGVVNVRHVVGKGRHAGVVGPECGPVRREMEPLVRLRETGEEMRLLEWPGSIDPAFPQHGL